MIEVADLPQYLTLPPSTAEVFGTLRKTTHGANRAPIWEIEADPQVAVIAKRLFPGAEGRQAGHAKFPANKRSFADLVWFLQRYPLRIENPDEFQAAYKETCDYVLKRQEILKTPSTRLPDTLFNGVLRPYQEESLAWSLTNRRTLIADGMGLGKTVGALAFLATEQAWPALIVPPSHLVRHWDQFVHGFLDVAGSDEGSLFAQGKPLVHVIRGTKDKHLPEAHIYIIHYLLLRAWRTVLRDLGIRRIIFDEIQDLRHAGTEKYSAASELSSLADDVIGLSGTPIYNRGGEIWNVMNIIEYHCLGDWDSFTREWCTGYGSDVVKEPERLNAYLRREGLMLRRRKEDVRQDLPAKERIVESIDFDDGLFAQFIGEAVKLARDAEEVKDHLRRGRMERQAINQTRLATGVAKAPAIAAFVRGILEAEEPTLVFAHHHAVVDILLDELKDFSPVVISGRESEAQKWANKEAFREGKTNLCIISLRSATGIDGLQERARMVVFAELDWSPAVHSQAEDRAHRDGQKYPVFCYYPVTDSGTDPDMMEALGFKISQFVGLMGDIPQSEQERELSGRAVGSHMKKILARLRDLKSSSANGQNDPAYRRFMDAVVRNRDIDSADTNPIANNDDVPTKE